MFIDPDIDLRLINRIFASASRSIALDSFKRGKSGQQRASCLLLKEGVVLVMKL